jgi:hypothetical protein
MYNFNNYEIMREPKEIDPNCEYIYVTDDENLKSDIWNIIVDHSLDGLSVFEKCYSVRFNMFKYATTPVCIYLDGSIQINKSLRKLYNDFMKSGSELGLNIHPERNRIDSEYLTWMRFRKYPVENCNRCMSFMESKNYNFDYKGLYQGTIRIEKNIEKNIQVDQITFKLLKILGTNEIERLDQTVYTYVLNTISSKLAVFPMSQQVLQSEYLTWNLHNTNKPIVFNKFCINDTGWVYNKQTRLYKLYLDISENKMKTYNGEKAIISMTSWKKRIDSVYYTINSLYNQCPGYHIVLVLSEDEFPEKENELPENLKTLLYNGYFELLWVKENTYSFKKMLPTMEKYPNVPIITADDGCVYYRNYADILYDLWEKEKDHIISFNNFFRENVVFGGGGSGILFPPGCFKDYKLTQAIIDTKHDDFYYGCLAKQKNIEWTIINDKPRNINFINLQQYEDCSVSQDFHINNYKEEDNLCNIIKLELEIAYE